METQEKSKLSSVVFVVICLVIMGLTAVSTVYGKGPGRSRYSRGGSANSIGFRAGWAGAPNGLTFRHVFSEHQALEFTAGYNIKEGRRTDLPWYAKGNTLIGVSYQPFAISDGGGDIGVGFYADFGARARIHNYRSIEGGQGLMVITPDIIGGGGMQIEFSESLELFGDIHIKYYNKLSNAWVWGVESGLGFRVKI